MFFKIACFRASSKVHLPAAVITEILDIEKKNRKFIATILTKRRPLESFGQQQSMGYRGGSRGRGRKGRGGGGSRRDRPVHEPEYIENRDGSSSSVGDESDTSSSSGEAFGTSVNTVPDCTHRHD